MYRGLFRIAAVAALSALLLTACEKSEAETAAEKAADTIAAWVETQLEANEDWVASYNGGVVRVTVTAGSGETLSKDGRADIYYAGFNFTSGSISSSTLFATNIESLATEAGWSLTGVESFDPVTVDLSDDDLVRGLRLGLAGAQAGEVCYILFTGEYGFGKKRHGTIPANAALAYLIEVAGLAD